ncbi:MAG: acyl-CoA synthetase, partial [Ramlibacter sp.]|nr:acyl-CoA synthetase [Ramlibacter sp.]
MNSTTAVALPTIDTPAPGMRFEDWMTATNVFDAIERTQKRHGGKSAITFLGTDPDTPPRKISYTELVDGIARTANAFRSLGLRRGDVVAYMLPSLVETQFVLWGATTAATALPLNPLLKAEEIANLCRAAGAKALVALGPLPGTDIWDKASRVKALVPAIGALIQVGGEKAGGHGTYSLADLMRAFPPELVFPDRPALDDVAAFFHTGGTTGAPKLVTHTHRNQLAAAYGGAWAVGAGTCDVIVNGLPMFHVASAIFCSLAMFIAGAEVVILSPAGFRNPRIVAGFWRIVARTGTTIVGGVPTALSAVVKVDTHGADLSRVRVNICGASLLARSVAEQMERLTGKPVREVYGMTESGGVICVDPVTRERVIGSAGCPIPFCEVEARPLDEAANASSRSCMPGEPGVLVVRGPNVTPGYKDAGQSAALFTEDGWLITGDVGHIDASGRVFITGRAKDLIIRSGHNIDPAVIEECLMRHPAVADAGAVGMPDAYAGEVPVAYVALRQDACVTEDELLAFAKASIAEPPALPRRLFILEQLPMTAVGKIYKPALRQDCARRHLLEMLQDEPIADLAVREEPGRGQVV